MEGDWLTSVLKRAKSLGKTYFERKSLYKYTMVVRD